MYSLSCKQFYKGVDSPDIVTLPTLHLVVKVNIKRIVVILHRESILKFTLKRPVNLNTVGNSIINADLY